jgi:hypothetical protein
MRVICPCPRRPTENPDSGRTTREKRKKITREKGAGWLRLQDPLVTAPSSGARVGATTVGGSRGSSAARERHTTTRRRPTKRERERTPSKQTLLSATLPAGATQIPRISPLSGVSRVERYCAPFHEGAVRLSTCCRRGFRSSHHSRGSLAYAHGAACAPDCGWGV